MPASDPAKSMADAGAPVEPAAPPALARRAAAGDAQAFARLVEATHATVYRVALRTLASGDRAEAEDVVQDTYIRAWQGIGKLAAPDAVVGWLCRIAARAAIDHARRGRARGAGRAVSFDDEDAGVAARLASPEPRADELVDRRATRDLVARALATLSDKHRVVLLLKEVDGMTAEEIGHALGLPTGTVESRLHRGRAILGQRIARIARGERARRWPWS